MLAGHSLREGSRRASGGVLGLVGVPLARGGVRPRTEEASILGTGGESAGGPWPISHLDFDAKIRYGVRESIGLGRERIGELSSLGVSFVSATLIDHDLVESGSILLQGIQGSVEFAGRHSSVCLLFSNPRDEIVDSLTHGVTCHGIWNYRSGKATELVPPSPSVRP